MTDKITIQCGCGHKLCESITKDLGDYTKTLIEVLNEDVEQRKKLMFKEWYDRKSKLLLIELIKKWFDMTKSIKQIKGEK